MRRSAPWWCTSFLSPAGERGTRLHLDNQTAARMGDAPWESEAIRTHGAKEKGGTEPPERRTIAENDN